MTALVLKNLRKRFGKTQALDGLSLTVPRGCVMGLVGPNGAGKTTAFGVVSGAVTADEGSVDLLGKGPFNPYVHAGHVAVLPQDCALNPHSSAEQILNYYGRLQGLSKKEARKESDRVLSMLHLGDRKDARVRQLSHGMKRRLAVAQALIGSPELILLDEPTGGLDPHLVFEMRTILRSFGRDTTLIISSHILSDIEDTCDRVAFIEAGKIEHEGTLDSLTQRSNLVQIRLGQDVPADEISKVLGTSVSYERGWYAYEVEDEESHQRLLKKLLNAGLPLLEVRLGESLEDAYLAFRETE